MPPTCAAAAALASRRRPSGRAAARRRARPTTWCATPTRASRAPSRTACCSTSHADLVFEGMTIAPTSIGARQGFLYLRGEYTYLREKLKAVLRDGGEHGLLGKNIARRAGIRFRHRDPARRRRLHLRRGVGADRVARRQARQAAQPPAVPGTAAATCDQPTVVNNVETFACAARIARARRAVVHRARHAAIDRHQADLVSGDCERPGMYEVPSASACGRCSSACGADDAQAVQVGGPSGTCICPEEFDRCIAFEDLPTARRLHGLLARARPVRGGAQLHAVLRRRELRLLHAVPRRHVAAARASRQGARRRGTKARPRPSSKHLATP